MLKEKVGLKERLQQKARFYCNSNYKLHERNGLFLLQLLSFNRTYLIDKMGNVIMYKIYGDKQNVKDPMYNNYYNYCQYLIRG